MKKLLGSLLLLALCASSAFASGKPKIQGLSWGTWTPQGFIASSDTTFLNGANLTTSISNDTTGPFFTNDMDLFPTFGGADANASSPAFKFIVSPSVANISVDSCFVIIQYSYDGYRWIDGASVTQGLLGNPTNNFAFPFAFHRIASASSVAQTTLPWASMFRFIVTADGNTAARMSGVRASVGYRQADEWTPKLIVKQLKWGTWSDGQFTAGADTSSLLSSRPDTTQDVSLIDLALPSSGLVTATGGTAADSTTCWLQVATIGRGTDTTDSLYIATEASYNGRIWNAREFGTGQTATYAGQQVSVQPGSSMAAISGGPLADGYIFLHSLGGVPATITQSRFWGDGFFNTGRVRFKLRSGTIVMPAANVYLSYLRVPDRIAASQ